VHVFGRRHVKDHVLAMETSRRARPPLMFVAICQTRPAVPTNAA
jgi:hypothetical protein